MGNNWKIAAIARCEANLRDIGALGGDDDSLRLGRVADAVHGLAGVLGVAGDLHTADPAGLAALLGLIGDELQRCNERAILDAARRAA